MIIDASRRPALILAAGLFVLLATPVTAATDSDDSGRDANKPTAAPVTHRTYRHVSHHRRHYVHHRLHAVAKADDDKDDKRAPTADVAAADNKVLPVIPPQVANANAQMLLAGAQISAAAAIPAGTGLPTIASGSANTDNQTVLVAADQLNDVDRTLQESSSTAATSAAPPAAPAPATAPTMTGESTVWDQTSLIGKIFIGFGALLTMASAARMFIT